MEWSTEEQHELDKAAKACPRQPLCDDADHRRMEADWDDLAGRCEGAEQAEKEMRAQVAALKPSGQVAEDVARLEFVLTEECPSDAAWTRARAALSRLAAGAQRAERLTGIVAYIQECDGGPHLLTEAKALAEDRVDDVRADLTNAQQELDAIRKRAAEATNLEHLIAEHGLPAAMRWVVDGTHPDFQCPRGPHHVAEHAQGGKHMLCGADGVLMHDGLRYPCSPTCTHDDAATPGHPERVKERSEALKSQLELEAEHPEAFAAGVESMRAACLEAVQEALGRLGITCDDLAWGDCKAAIEGATP